MVKITFSVEKKVEKLQERKIKLKNNMKKQDFLDKISFT
jgi:hypothetical protein